MKFGFVFPGQGSQSVGMFDRLNKDSSIFTETLKEASEEAKIDIIKMATDGSVSELNKTVNTQLIMLASGVASYRLWIDAGGRVPDVMAGHSLGEYPALVSAGVIDLKSALTLVIGRANLMQNAVPEGVGGIAAILGLEPSKIEQLCEKFTVDENRVEAANYNSPIQTVVAGTRDAVKNVMDAALKNGAKKAIMLPMSVPSHCTLLNSVIPDFKKILGNTKFLEPKVPVIQNARLRANQTPEEIKRDLEKQLVQPVHWTKTIEIMVHEFEVQSIFEMGPGKVLTGLGKRISRQNRHVALDDIEVIKSELVTE